MIEELVLKKIIEVSFKGISSFLKKKGKSLRITNDKYEQSINSHMKYVLNWSKDVNFRDLKDPKQTSSIYIDLEYFLTPRENNIDNKQSIEKVGLNSIFDRSDNHLVILGQPGAGKTTTMKYICQKVFYDENFYPDRFNIPILIRLRDIEIDGNNNKGKLLFHKLFEILGFNEYNNEGITQDYSYSFIQECVLRVIDELKLIIIFDGFDEIPTANQKDEIIKELTYLSLNVNTSKIIVTSRTSDFQYNIENMNDFEISPLSNCQIEEFTCKYINDPEKGKDLYTKILKSPFADTAMRPLTLAHLCALYENYGDIPDRPKTIYKKVVNLLLENWDAQRAVKRHSKYGNFPVERKLDFLCNLAYLLTTWKSKSLFTSTDLEDVYKKINNKFNIPIQECLEVIKELESHNGLFIKSGFDQFEFAHKSIQEYLTAEFLVKLGFIPNNIPLFHNIANELAISVAIASDQTNYFANIVFNYIIPKHTNVKFINTFMSRINLERPDFEINLLFLVTSLSLASQALGTYNNNEIKETKNLFFNMLEIFGCTDRLIEVIKSYKESNILTSGEFITLELDLSIQNEYGFSFPRTITTLKTFLN